MKKLSHHYIILSGLLFTFFYTWSSNFSLISLWLNQKIKLDGTETGLVFSVTAISALLTQPFYGFIQDKLGLKKSLLWFLGFTLVISGPFLVLLCTPIFHYSRALGSILVGMYSGAVFSAGIGVLESYTERVSRIINFEYGKSRMWGSLGWAVATLFAGVIFNINPDINFWIASVAAVIFLVLLWQLKEIKLDAFNTLEYGNPARIKLQDAFNLMKLPHFWYLVLFVVGVSIYNVYDQQFPIYFASMFHNVDKGDEMFGFLNSSQVFLEAGGMFIAPFISNKIGARNGLLLSGLIMATRIFGSGFAHTATTLAMVKLLHSLELPILLISLFKYITTQFDPRLSATLYLVAFNFVSSLCAGFFSPIAGSSYDRFGFATTYQIMGVLVLLFTCVSCFLLHRRPKETRLDIPAKTVVVTIQSNTTLSEIL